MFKIVSAAQDISICLRCQYRLSVREEPRLGRRHCIGYYQQLQRFTSGASPQQSPLVSHDAATQDDYLLRKASIRYSNHEPSFNRTYRFEDWPPQKDSLGLNVLGEPAEVLILRDKRRRLTLDSAMAKVRTSIPDTNPDPEPISSSEMLEEMNAEKGSTDPEEACKNIQSVKTSWAAETQGSITDDTYNDLVFRLNVGFTRLQLLAYLEKANKGPVTDPFNLNFKLTGGLYARSSWQPLGSTPPGKTSAPRINRNKKEKLERENGQTLSKEELVKMIVRQCWNIRTESQESSLGELDIRLREQDLNLIIKHKSNILKQMSRSYDCKVEAWPGPNIIRITSDYDNCIDVNKLLVYTIENITCTKVGLDVLSTSDEDSTLPPRKLDKAVVKQINQYTNTIMTGRHPTFHIYHLGPDNAELLETQRVIYQILRPTSTQVPKLTWSRGEMSSNARPVPVIVNTRLSMLDRNQEWSRWSTPHFRDVMEENGKDEFDTYVESVNGDGSKENRKKDGTPPSRLLADRATRAVAGFALNTVKSFFAKSDHTSSKIYNTDTPYWTQNIEYHDSVTFGQILFPTDRAQKIAEALAERQLRGLVPRRRKRKTQDAEGLAVFVRERLKAETKIISVRDIVVKSLRERREFVSLVPGLVLTLGAIGRLKKNEDYLQIRLSPSSKNTSLPVPIKALPDLEIRIFLDDENETTSIKDVRLVARVEKDLLQPESVFDLRFIRKQCVYASAKLDPCIKAFLEQSNLNIWGTEPLKTPQGFSLSIPALAVQSHQGFDPNAHETLLVDYFSLGLEHRSSLIVPYRDPESWPTLTYTNIEAGRIGGRRDELSLHSHRFVSEQQQQQPPTTTDLDHPSSAASTEIQTLSEDGHAAILFEKTMALAESIQKRAQESTKQWKIADRLRYHSIPL